jgi:hypothetical protein
LETTASQEGVGNFHTDRLDFAPAANGSYPPNLLKNNVLRAQKVTR